jgi:hypothetical protein
MSILLGVLVLFALLTLALAVQQAMVISRLAPTSERLGSFFPLGWWKFGQLEAKAGAAAAPHLAIYKRAVIAFLIFLLAGLILSGWVVNRQPSAPAAEAATLNDWRVLPAHFASNTVDPRRAAPMPGALLES